MSTVACTWKMAMAQVILSSTFWRLNFSRCCGFGAGGQHKLVSWWLSDNTNKLVKWPSFINYLFILSTSLCVILNNSNNKQRQCIYITFQSGKLKHRQKLIFCRWSCKGSLFKAVVSVNIRTVDKRPLFFTYVIKSRWHATVKLALQAMKLAEMQLFKKSLWWVSAICSNFSGYVSLIERTSLMRVAFLSAAKPFSYGWNGWH